MQQTFTNPPMNNIQQQQQQQQHHQYHQLMTHLGAHEDHQQHILTEQQQQQQQHQQHQYHHQNHHQGYTHMPSSTTMSSTPLTASLNQQGLGGGHYTPLVTSEGLSQYCSSTAASSLFNCCSTTSSSSSSASSSPSHDSNSPCLSPASSISNMSEKRNTPSIGVNLRVTGQCSQGGRKYMEDYFSVAYQQSENAKDLEYAFIGIYDGHGGAEAATFAKEHLMMEIINQRLFWSDSDHDVLRAIREGYIATHYAMWRHQDKWPKTANGLPSTAGTTATVAFIRREKIYIGHVGDSGIVLGYQNENENFWRAKQLTVDHKPESLEERTRIMNSGGKVVIKSGVPRVVWNRPRNANHRGPIKQKTPIDEIPFLAVARSLGDLWSYNSERNEFVVSPDPDVKVIPINPKTFRCLIFGTDGLWNVVNPQESVNTVREKELINEHLQAQRGDSPHEGNQWTNPSKSLVDQALKTWSNKKMRADNTSVVTVILYPPGQGGHNNNLHPSSNIAPPPAFVQPASYGLEYTQVQAEIAGYDNATTYREMAMKYLPPEEYRNFNYYSEDSEPPEEDAETDESEAEEDVEATDEAAAAAAETSASLLGSVDHNGYPLHTSTWNWQHNSSTIQSMDLKVTDESSLACLDAEKVGEEMDEDGDDEEEEEEDENEDVAVNVNVTANTNHCQPANDGEVCVLNYQNYINVGAVAANTATNNYSYSESYNTIQAECLSAATIETKRAPPTTTSTTTPTAAVITPTNSNSSSNSSNCQSVSPPNMHALIEEQQLYQQQCMSQEDGYCLTKLETRREQQSCKLQDSHTAPASSAGVGVEAFKIFHQQQNSQTLEAYNNTTCHTERYYQQHTGFMPQLQQKPLELHSLLQQEREEEQQVAFERQQLQNKLVVNQQHNIAAYACLQAIRNDPVLPLYPATVSMLERATNPMELDNNDEYIEEIHVANAQLTTVAEDSMKVQINEISSSSCGEIDDECEKFVTPCRPLTTTTSRARGLDTVKEIVYEILSPQKKRTADAVHCLNNRSLNARRTSFKLGGNSNSCLPSTSVNTPPAARSLGKRSRSFIYANVPKENVDRTAGYSSQNSLRRSLSMTPSCSNKLTCNGMLRTPPVASSTPMISRQLRSNTSNCNPNTPLDYGKRNLRTRNSLAKDMKSKSKSSLVQAALKYPHHNSVTRKFLRTSAAAAALMVGNSNVLMQQEQNSITNNRLSINNNNNNNNNNPNNGHNSVHNRSIKTTRNISTNTPTSSSLSHQTQTSASHHLNLRSRQSSIVPISTSQMLNLNSSISESPPPPSSSTSATAPVIKRASSLADRRNLRSMHTRSSSSRIGPSLQASFSKTTRSQSTGTNLAAPPPSPKMINAAAVAVAAATRARSLLTQKHAAEVNGGSGGGGRRSVVTAVFGKRVNLRSNGLREHESSSGGGGGGGGGGMIPKSGELTTMRTPSTHQTLRGRIVKKFKR